SVEYTTANNFFKKQSIKNMVHTLKILSFSHPIFNPSQKNISKLSPRNRRWEKWYRDRLFKGPFLKFKKWVFAALSIFTVLAAVWCGEILCLLRLLPFVLLLT